MERAYSAEKENNNNNNNNNNNKGEKKGVDGIKVEENLTMGTIIAVFPTVDRIDISELGWIGNVQLGRGRPSVRESTTRIRHIQVELKMGVRISYHQSDTRFLKGYRWVWPGGSGGGGGGAVYPPSPSRAALVIYRYPIVSIFISVRVRAVIHPGWIIRSDMLSGGIGVFVERYAVPKDAFCASGRFC